MSQPSCGGSVQLCALRIAVLDTDGSPLPGDGNLYVSNQAIELTTSSEVSEGEDFEQKNGCGEIIVAYKDRDRIKRLTLGLDLGHPDPEITEMLVGGDVITNTGGDVIGFAYPSIDDQPVTPGVSVEGWSKRVVSGAQAADYPWFRWVYPKTTWQIGDRTMGNDVMITSFTGFGEENAGFFDGPANDHPDPTVSERVLTYFADTDIPAASCGAQELLAS